MKRKIAAISVSWMLILNLFLLLIEIAPFAAGTTIYVDDDYSVEDPTHKMTIQAAVDAALPGDYIYVYNGNYAENVWIDKTLTITGEDQNNTVIDGGMMGDSVTIFADWVNISGFKITSGDPSGIYITSFSVNNTIENNTIIANQFSGMEIYWYSDYNTIANNTIMNNPGSGVLMEFNNQYNRIVDNYLNNNGFSGVLIDNPSSSDPNFNNYITNNVINNSQYGVYLYDSNDDNHIEGNFINNTDYGIILSTFNENNVITKNTVMNSDFFNIYLWAASNNNRIYHNNFLNEVNLAYDTGVNQWNLSYPNGGNFWGNYSGGDNKSGPSQNTPGNDAIGDVPILIGGGANIDYYPLWPNWDALELYKPAPGPKNACEYAIGSVKVAVFFVESNGSIDPESEDWSDSRRSMVLSEVQEALTFWEGLEADSDLTFSIEDMGRSNTSYEAITRASSDSDLWIGEIMDNLGFDSDFYLLEVMSFNHWLREQYDTDWAFSIFVADSFNDSDGFFADPPRSAWAIWMAGLVVMTYDNGGYGINFMNNVAAHETGHMFYATDEYKDPGERSGYLNALEVDNSGALMDVNNLWLSSGTELQVGWRDSDSDGTMDILDTEPNTYLEPYEPDPTFIANPVYSGYAVVVPYPNENPNGYSLDVTLNTISNVQFRIDNGSWINATSSDGAFDEEIEAFSFSTPSLSSGTHFIEVRSINSVNNSDPTYANDTITILGDSIPPEISETTSDVPRSGDSNNVTADVVDTQGVDTVWLEYTITSSEGYVQSYNVSMSNSGGNSYWVEPSIWSNTSWFNYTISANDTNNNWNGTLEKSLNFRVHNLDSGFGFIAIQPAIDDFDTLDDHTIFVGEGTYFENVVVRKSINLIGEDKENTIIDGNLGDNIFVDHTDYVNITNFSLINGIRGIYLYTSSNCIISNNLIHDFGPIPTDAMGIFLYAYSNDNTIIGNDIYNLKSTGDVAIGVFCWYYSGNNIILLNNINNLTGDSQYGIGIDDDSDNINIERNHIQDLTGIDVEAYGIRSIGSSNVYINSNYISNLSGTGSIRGINIETGMNCTIISNYVSNIESDSSGYGISLWSYRNNSLINNTILNVSHIGIYIGAHYVNYNNIIFNNTISFSYNGIYLSESSQNNITENNVSRNNGCGIYFDSSSNNTVNDNYIAENGWGINITSSIDNKIFHNHIINNTNQAFDDSVNGNQWDNGYPSGGNFWSDYSGKDLYSGPNQDIPGDDRIGDTNYTIDSDSRDNYPLMGEIGDHLFLYEGWNLISLPFIQLDTNLSLILSSISGSYDAVQWFNISDPNDPWKDQNVGKLSGNDLFELKETMGFWIKITDSPGVVFEYPGIQPAVNQTISLHPGWNLVGYPSLSSYNRTIGLNNLEFGKDVNVIQWYNTSTQTWHFMDMDDNFVPGRGYWIHSLEETTWEVPV